MAMKQISLLFLMLTSLGLSAQKTIYGYIQDAQDLLATPLSPKALALDTHLFFGGLLHMWIKDADGSRFRNQAIELIKSHMNLRRKQN